MKNFLYLVLFSFLLPLSGCNGNSAQHGNLESNSYQPATKEFSLTIPQGAKVSDGTHALGKFLVIRGLPKPVEIRGISYNRVANVNAETSQEAKNSIVKAGHDFWAKTYTGAQLNVIHSEWIELDGMPVYFTVLEGQPAGLLVKPNLFYGTLSFLKGKYSYVLFDRARSEKMLVGTEGRPEAANPELRKRSIMAFFNTVKFQ